jgi:hypothetical protein
MIASLPYASLAEAAHKATGGTTRHHLQATFHKTVNEAVCFSLAVEKVV